MSWTTNGVVADGKQFPFAIEDLKIVGEATPEAHEALEAAKDAIVALVDSGAFGDKSHTFRVNASGHANPGHEPTPGWTNDSVSVSVYQMGEQDINFLHKHEE